MTKRKKLTLQEIEEEKILKAQKKEQQKTLRAQKKIEKDIQRKKSLEIGKTEFLENLEKQYSDFDLGWIPGFVGGEGCFNISFSITDEVLIGVSTSPLFEVTQNEASFKSMEKLQKILGCGTLEHKSKKKCYVYSVWALKDLLYKIIPFFEKYPLDAAKAENFIKFANICRKMSRKEHLLTEAGLIAIIKEAYTMNSSGKQRGISCEELISYVHLRKRGTVASKEVVKEKIGKRVLKKKKTLKEKKILMSQEEREKRKQLRAERNQQILNNRELEYSDFEKSKLAGVADAEGCFSVSFVQSDTCRLGFHLTLKFKMFQSTNSVENLEKLLSILNCGHIHLDIDREGATFSVGDFESIVNKVIPFFEKYLLETIKSNDFVAFANIAKKRSQGDHLTAEGLVAIAKEAYKMNGDGKQRDFLLEELISIIEQKDREKPKKKKVIIEKLERKARKKVIRRIPKVS